MTHVTCRLAAKTQVSNKSADFVRSGPVRVRVVEFGSYFKQSDLMSHKVETQFLCMPMPYCVCIAYPTSILTV